MEIIEFSPISRNQTCHMKWPNSNLQLSIKTKHLYNNLGLFLIKKNSHGKSVGNSESWIQFCIYGFGLGGGGLDGAFFWGIIWDDFPSDGVSVWPNDDSNPKPPAGAESNAFHGSLLEIINRQLYYSYFKRVKARLTNHPKSEFYFRCHPRLKK